MATGVAFEGDVVVEEDATAVVVVVADSAVAALAARYAEGALDDVELHALGDASNGVLRDP